MNKKLSWLICSLVALTVLVAACATPTSTTAPMATPTPTTAPSLTPTPVPYVSILRFMAEGTVVEVPNSWWGHGLQAHAVRFSMSDFSKILDFAPDTSSFFWREIRVTDLGAMALLRCWTRCETTAGPKFPTCFLDLSWIPSGGHIRPLEEEPAFWVDLVEINSEYDKVTMAWGDWRDRLPTGVLPNLGEKVYLIGNYKGLQWDIVPW